MKCLRISARVEELEAVLSFVRQVLENHDCSARAMFQIELAVEEIFVNIASYAYSSSDGNADIYCGVNQESRLAEIRFEDWGIPFDPLAREQADTSPEGLQGRIGGLGILLVKRNMDEVTYAYQDEKNILTIRKNIT